MSQAVAGHGQQTIDGKVVVHLAPDELVIIIGALSLSESMLVTSGFDRYEEGSLLVESAELRHELARILS